MTQPKPICGKPVGSDSRCGLKPDHQNDPMTACCQTESYCCPRQHYGGLVFGCSSCNGEDIAALRSDVDALRSQILSRKPARVRASVWAADIAHGIVGAALGRLMVVERWLSRRQGA